MWSLFRSNGAGPFVVFLFALAPELFDIIFNPDEFSSIQSYLLYPTVAPSPPPPHLGLLAVLVLALWV